MTLAHELAMYEALYRRWLDGELEPVNKEEHDLVCKLFTHAIARRQLFLSGYVDVHTNLLDGIS